MQIVWSCGEATADDVRNALAPERQLKESTVRTILRRLEDKGHLKHTVRGRTYVYRAAESPRNLALRAVRQIIDRFCAGSVEQLVAGMVAGDLIDPDELRAVVAKVEAARKTGGRK
jgi:BlaI family penicillinase repressor